VGEEWPHAQMRIDTSDARVTTVPLENAVKLP
jgi:hypothetical protein